MVVEGRGWASFSVRLGGRYDSRCDCAVASKVRGPGRGRIGGALSILK